jgi:hypothetical protein
MNRQISYRFELLNPSVRCEQYDRYMHSMQKLRAKVYLQDGAIQASHLTPEGRHCVARDRESWHFLVIDDRDEVAGCVRYLLHPNTVEFSDLLLRHSALARDPVWGPHLRAAVARDLEQARTHDLWYAELGGWALSKEYRGTRAALKMLLASYAWGRLIGGCICSCTATVRNNSALILRRIGGVSLKSDRVRLPAYEDPLYGCTMEVLRFDSRSAPARYETAIRSLQIELQEAVLFTSNLLHLGTALGKANPVAWSVSKGSASCCTRRLS